MKSSLPVGPFVKYITTRYEGEALNPSVIMSKEARHRTGSYVGRGGGLATHPNPVSIWAIAVKISKRLPERFPDSEHVRRSLMRYKNGPTKTIPLNMAEDLCDGLDIHPTQIWGHQYHEATAAYRPRRVRTPA